MVFTGPGLYEILPYQAPLLSIQAWEGLMTAGAEVKTYARENPPLVNSNATWVVAAVTGSGGTVQYVISNARTGYFITATAAKTTVSTPQVSPSSASARWTIAPATSNGYEVFTINSVSPDLGQLSVKGGSIESGAEIMAWQVDNTDNQKFYFEPVAL